MRHMIKTTALAALLALALPAAQAATQLYAFSGTLESGALLGTSYQGQFSFDDASLTLTGEEYLGVDSLAMSFLGNQWGLALAEAATEVKFVNGTFAGLSYNATLGATGFSTIPGSIDATDAFVAYTTTLGNDGTGSLVYAPVPEPESYAMLLAGLAAMGVIARRRKS
jgi:hypothetical protein